MKLTKPKTILQWIRIYTCYRQSFPRAERKPFGVIVKMYRQGKSDVWYLEENGAFAGLASTINGEGLILLDYFAVAKGCRGQGFGTAALQLLQKHYSGSGLFVEIERVWPGAPNAQEREKRKQFYCNCSMEPLHVEAEVFGVEMELLGSRCTMTFRQYHDFYRDHYGAWAAEHIKAIG